jgi:hypothetical protein
MTRTKAETFTKENAVYHDDIDFSTREAIHDVLLDKNYIHKTGQCPALHVRLTNLTRDKKNKDGNTFKRGTFEIVKVKIDKGDTMEALVSTGKFDSQMISNPPPSTGSKLYRLSTTIAMNGAEIDKTRKGCGADAATRAMEKIDAIHVFPVKKRDKIIGIIDDAIENAVTEDGNANDWCNDEVIDHFDEYCGGKR